MFQEQQEEQHSNPSLDHAASRLVKTVNILRFILIYYYV